MTSSETQFLWRAARSCVALSAFFGSVFGAIGCSLIYSTDGLSSDPDSTPGDGDGLGGMGGGDGDESSEVISSGQDGPLRVLGTESPNEFVSISRPALTGSFMVELAAVDESLWAQAQARVLIWRTLGEASSGGEEAATLSTDVGSFHLARITQRVGSQVTLDSALPFDIPNPETSPAATQMVYVPEYTRVEIPEGSALSASAWNGTTGGIVAFMADEVELSGSISMNARGLRGGAPSRSGVIDCTESNGTAELGYGGKGEGLDPTRYGEHAGAGGPLNFLNGGGGAPCASGGGAGGGHGGRGGGGAHEYFSGSEARADGGSSVSYPPITRLISGAGGGGGQGNVVDGTRGGAGGGVILIWTRTMHGPGTLTTDGEAAQDPLLLAEDSAGSGGGGSGGSIHVFARESLACGLASARGGAGGTSSDGSGPARYGSGGGGGGGVVMFSSPVISCDTDLAGGAPGMMSASTPLGHQAEAGEAGELFTRAPE